MKTITTTEALAEFCKAARTCPYVTVDTEFLRERTYYAQLCLVQLAYRSEDGEDEVLVDALATGLDLAPLYDLFRDTSVTKVFHAARQDLEIFYIDGGVIPAPLFDTQVAAMVCGFGEQVGYETLVRRICKSGLDKSSRFTDWSRRPLSEKQMRYALADVTHLRDIYEALDKELTASGRDKWVTEEMATLTSADTYVVTPQEAWRRVKTRSASPRFIAVVQKLAALREELAQSRNVPRSRIFKDDVILELAATRPTKQSDLSKSRLLQRDARKGDIAERIVAAIEQAMALDNDDLPHLPEPKRRKQGHEGLTDLLRVLLKARAAEVGVAQKLIATASELEDLADTSDKGHPVLKGWRRDVFGADAMRLRDGKIALSANGESVSIVEL